MTKSKYRVNIDNLKPIQINHGTGIKKVFISNEETDTALTQFAFSSLNLGTNIDFHSHSTMDEYFFCIKGDGKFEIGDEVLELKPGDFIRIPSSTPHKLQVSKKQETLELLYFGVATDI